MLWDDESGMVEGPRDGSSRLQICRSIAQGPSSPSCNSSEQDTQNPKLIVSQTCRNHGIRLLKDPSLG